MCFIGLPSFLGLTSGFACFVGLTSFLGLASGLASLIFQTLLVAPPALVYGVRGQGL